MRCAAATAFSVLALVLALTSVVLVYFCVDGAQVDSRGQLLLDVGTLIVLAATCAAAVWYGWWTQHMAKKTQELAEATQLQVRAALAPLLEIPTTRGDDVTLVQNRGGGPAHRLALTLVRQDGSLSVLCEGRELHPLGILRFEMVSNAANVIRATYEDSWGHTHERAWRGVEGRKSSLEVEWIDAPTQQAQVGDAT